MKRTMLRAAVPLLCMLTALNGCTAQGSSDSVSISTAETAADTDQTTAASTTVIDVDGAFSDRDLDGSYDESTAVRIALSGDSASCDSGDVSIQGSQIIIQEEGVYLVTGTLTDGQIVVNAGDTDKVQIVLDGAQITSSTSAAIYALEADKVFVTLADGSQNTLTNGGEYIAIDDNNIDAVIFAKTDLTLNGTGSLTIEAAAGHGVVSKDDLVITQGSYTVTAASHGLSGKDSVAIAGGTFNITSGKDGIHSENADDLSLGTLYIADGDFTIHAQGDAISAESTLRIDGGSFDLTTGEGSAAVEMTTDLSGFTGGRGAMPGEMAADTTSDTTADTGEETSDSRKGIKAEGSFTLLGGSYTADTEDDCFHAGGDLTIEGGTFQLSSGDDAIHSDSNLVIGDGTFDIPYCYEGLEGLAITIDDGSFNITSQDDGLNAAGGADSSGFGGRGGDSFTAQTGVDITINGGSFVVVSQGDCIDSNGTITINGGTLDLTCNGNGNTALDAEGTYTNNGGDVTTNDGSENSLGQMGGGQTGGGQMGGKQGGGRQMDGELPGGQLPDGAQLPDGTEPGTEAQTSSET